MSNEAKNEMPRGLKPVQSVELSENHLKTKWILVGAFVVLALVAFGIAINGWLSEEPGWVEIEATAGKVHCGEDFIFSYCLGVKKIGTVRATNFLYLNPVVAVITSALFLGEKITGLAMVGAALILCGLFFIDKARKR